MVGWWHVVAFINGRGGKDEGPTSKIAKHDAGPYLLPCLAYRNREIVIEE